MGLSALGGLLESSPEYQRLLDSLRAGPASARVQVLAEGVPFTLATLWRGLGTPMLVIAPRPEDARRLHEQLVVWSGQESAVLHFPETETLPFERLVSDIETTQHRLSTLATLATMPERDEHPLIVVASAVAVAQKTIDKTTFTSSTHTLKTRQRVNMEATAAVWQRMGYRFEAAADQPGLASRRGGIIDIFPVGAPLPVRIELWGDEIESIRSYDPATQRSLHLVESVTIIPARETLPGLSDRDEVDRLIGSIDVSNCTESSRDRLSEELDLLLEGSEVEDLSFYAGLFNRGLLLDYFPQDGLLVSHRPSDIAEAALAADERTFQLRDVKERRGELPYGFPSLHASSRQVEELASDIGRRLDLLPWGADLGGFESHAPDGDVHFLPFTPPPSYFGNTDRFAQATAEMMEEGHRIVACTSVPNRLSEILDEHGIGVGPVADLDTTPPPGSMTVLHSTGAGLREGCVLPVNGQRLVVLSDAEIFGVAKERRSTRRALRTRDTLLSELNPGDYVVHVEHGIGRFVGTGRTPRDEGEREYLIVQYAAGDKLYVPMDHLDRVSPYIAPMDRPPTLTRLGTQEWRRTKERVERSTKETASELLTLYASRELVGGHAFGSDTPWQVELEDSFPYEETPDQQTALSDLRSDMEQSKPMDRLVCGDVGYGKTEVALRAAFKAVMDGKQVAVLVPTTVLAQQHYVTFTQRLRAYPVAVEVLSRFRTDQEQRHIVEGLAAGRIDICIGTHRLIQKDVRFKELGLVVIDEEQRFGVAQKERLKQMRTEVDVLTLTATPIPRTLHLSLAGVRDMSIIETPPEERLPIKTYVSEFSDELIKDAIRREIDRQGQVFFLHNRVYNIDYMAEYVRRLVPEAQVAVAHGQMPEDQLERTMLTFAEGKADVLVCTTIIESGLDIPNVNTLIVNRADTFGLAQLYQLRGRVGRSARRAYSYLLIPPTRSLSEAAEKRLRTMLAATELGAGFQIAMKDLEIRGAGNILGAAQSGHIHAVGFDLYTRLLSEAVEALRAQRAAGGQGLGTDVAIEPFGSEAIYGLDARPETQTSVDLGIPASIPEEYVSDLPIRLSMYHRLARVASLGEVDSLQEELVDRFGTLPWQAQNLLYILRLKLLATEAGVQTISREDGRIVLRVHGEVGGARPALQRVLGKAIHVGHAQIRLELGSLSDGWEGPLMEIVQKFSEFRQRVTAQVEAVVAT